jgi:hypothetical protein
LGFSALPESLLHGCLNFSGSLAELPRFSAENKLHRDALLLFLAYPKLEKILLNW